MLANCAATLTRQLFNCPNVRSAEILGSVHRNGLEIAICVFSCYA